MRFNSSLMLICALTFCPTVTYAEELKFKISELNKVTASDRVEIEKILKRNRLMSPVKTISSEDDFRGFLGLPDITIPNPIEQACKAACDISAAAAISACAGLTSGVAITACSAAAVVARDSCRSGC